MKQIITIAAILITSLNSAAQTTQTTQTISDRELNRRIKAYYSKDISEAFGVYSGIVTDESGKKRHKNRITIEQYLKNTCDYLKKNDWINSNVYRPNFAHWAVNVTNNILNSNNS
jgi:hypothetical protein